MVTEVAGEDVDPPVDPESELGQISKKVKTLYLESKFESNFHVQILDVLYATADGFEVPEGEEAVDADEPDEY